MDWQDILISFLLNGVLVLIIKALIDAAHARDMARIETTQAKELAHLNAELNRIQMIQSTQFTDLHKRRAEVMAELYKLLARAERQLNSTKIVVPSYKGDNKPDWKRFIEKTRPIHEAVSAVSDFYDENKILLSPEQARYMDEIVSIFKEVRLARTMREHLTEMPPEDEEESRALWESIRGKLLDADQQFNGLYPNIKANLEFSFRQMLGFDIMDNQATLRPTRH